MIFYIFLTLFFLQPIEGDPFIQINSTKPNEYYLREKLVRSGCWPLNNVPDVWPVLNRNELPINVAVLPYFEIITNVDDKAQA